MIEINNLTTNPVDEEFFKKVAKIVLEEEKKDGNLSIALIGSGRMKKLNKKYLGKNRVTDVLAFPEAKAILKKMQGLGEVVICLREVKKNAKRYNLTFEKELAKVLIHGILHLSGYNHKKMEEREECYLSKIGHFGEGSGELISSPV